MSASPLAISHFQAEELLAARGAGAPSASVSLDLGMTRQDAGLCDGGVLLPNQALLSWADIAKVARDDHSCYLINDGRACKIQVFSEETNRHYSLFPTPQAPTMLVAGFTMHRIKGVGPLQDTQLKVGALKPVRGQILDTCTGLGYTAIQLAEFADHVTTVEIDPAASEICRCNPWSQKMFENPAITQMIGDSGELVAEFADAAFDRILHDPPTFSLAGQLYAGEFYRQLRRVLRPGGQLFHYVGDPVSKTGRRTTQGVTRRLNEAGFSRVTPLPRAHGVAARK